VLRRGGPNCGLLLGCGHRSDSASVATGPPRSTIPTISLSSRLRQGMSPPWSWANRRRKESSRIRAFAPGYDEQGKPKTAEVKRLTNTFGHPVAEFGVARAIADLALHEKSPVRFETLVQTACSRFGCWPFSARRAVRVSLVLVPRTRDQIMAGLLSVQQESGEAYEGSQQAITFKDVRAGGRQGD